MTFENLRIKEIRSVIHYVPTMKRWKTQNRKEHLMGVQLSGAVHHRFEHRNFVLSGNCVYFFNQRDDYEAEVWETGEAFSVHFTTYEEVETDSFCIPLDSSEGIVALLEKIERQSKRTADGELALLSAAYALCDALSAAHRKAYMPKDVRMFSAKAYMDERFAEKDCLKSVTAQSGLSARRFGELFSGNFHMTPNRYLTAKRMEYAKRLLEAECLSVTEISDICGFSDVYYFSKVFKRFFGIPPSRWK